MIKEFNGFIPKIDSSVYIDQTAQIIGKVKIDSYSSLWPGVILRADVDEIIIGQYTNIQDYSIAHPDYNLKVQVGNYVTIGHGVIFHGCQIGNNCLIGMGAIILSGVKIGNNCLIAAGCVVPENKEIPDGSLAMGVPAKIIRQLNEQEVENIKKSALDYFELAKKYRR